VRAKAQERLLRLQYPAIDTLARLMDQLQSCPSAAYREARDVLDRTLGTPTETVKQDGNVELRIKCQS